MKLTSVLVLTLFALTALSFKVEEPVEEGVVPIAVFAGFGDACINPGMSRFAKYFGKALNTTSKCITIGNGAASSIFMNFEEQGKAACEAIAKDPTFDGEFSVVGNSQGGLLARYVVEKCTNLKGKVRNFVTFGAPHYGVAKLPHCFHGIICNAINAVIDWGIYWTIVQNNIAPAGYFRDVHHLDYYKEHSTFLPSLNNEREFNQEAYDRFSSLNKLFLAKFSKDTMIYPASTAWFEQLQPDGSILPFNETEAFQNDYLGLKKLYEEDRIIFFEFEGDHLQFNYDQIDEFVLPVLAS